MSRWIRIGACALLGILLVICGLLVPMYLRAIDASVLQAAGRHTPGLLQHAQALLAENKLGPAQMLLKVASEEGLPSREGLIQTAANLARQEPRLQFWGCPAPRLETLREARQQADTFEPITHFVVRQENRSRILEWLGRSRQASVHELLRCRSLTNTVLFAPSWTSSGQAFDAALAVTALLVQEGRLSADLSGEIMRLAVQANRGENSQRLEQALLDFMSLGQRLNWGQLTVFVEPIRTTDTLRNLAGLVRRSEAALPVLFCAVQLSGNPAELADYALTLSDGGIKDLRRAFHYGTGAVEELLERKKRVTQSAFTNLWMNYRPFDALAELAWRAPWLALILKWLLYLWGGFFLAVAAHLIARRRQERYPVYSPALRGEGRADEMDVRPVPGFHFAREILFALGFLLVVLLLSEPFLAQESQKVEFPFRLRLPSLGSAAPAAAAINHSKIMNQLSLLTLLLFFVLQGLIYTACVFKLAEIRRQKVPARIKLKLLENEDHLFDAGLYLGFVGTIISLILVSLGVIKPSLMAAYSSTSFGIIFVSAFKIFNLRPVRRRLLLEAENDGLRSAATAPSQPWPTQA